MYDSVWELRLTIYLCRKKEDDAEGRRDVRGRLCHGGGGQSPGGPWLGWGPGGGKCGEEEGEETESSSEAEEKMKRKKKKKKVI